MPDQDEWEDVPQKKASTATATADGEWEDVPAKAQAGAPDFSAAKARVAQPLNFEKALANQSKAEYEHGLGEETGPEHAASRALSAAMLPTSIKDIPAWGARMIGKNEEHPYGQWSPAAAVAPITEPIKEAWKNPTQENIVGAVPFIGPTSVSMAQDVRNNDYTGAGGTLLGTIGALRGGHEVAPGLSALNKELPSAKTVVKFPGAVIDKIARGTPITEEGKIAAAKKQALTVKKPTMNETEYAQQVNDAMPELQKIAQDNKGKIKTPRQAVQAINNRISQIEAPIADHIAGQTAEHQLVQPTDYQDAINSAMDKELAKRPGVYKPDEIEKAKKAVTDFIGDQPKTLTEIEGNRKRLNQDADAYHKADTAGKRAIDVSDATATAQRAAANAIRDVLYGEGNNAGKLEQAGVTARDANGNPVSLRNVRKQVGRLLNVRDHFEDAITRAEATGDWKAFGPIFSGPSLAAGGLGVAAGSAVGGLPGVILGGLLGEGAKAWGDYLRTKNPNLNIEKMFRNLAATSAPNVPQIHAMTPPVPRSAMPAAVQQPLGLPTPEHGPLFNIEQTPRLRPDVETARIPPIGGEQIPLNLPPENAPLFNINQTPVPSPQKIGGWNPLDIKNAESVVGKPSEVPSPVFRGTAENMKPAATLGQPEALNVPRPEQLKPGESTADKFYDKAKDQWSPEREANHKAIAEAATAGKTPPTGRPPEATITVGGTGAGKTTVTRSIMADDPNLVNVDSDANKLQVPEYEGLKKTDPQKAAARVHDESKAISKRIIQAAVGKGLDFVYDTSTGGGGEPLFKKLKDLGYNVKIVYADLPVEEAIKRADLRARESTDPSNRGRVVPEEIIRKKHAEAAQAFLEHRNSPSVSEVRAFDTTTRTPEEFYNRSAAGEKITNQKTLNRVREKAGVHAGK